MLWFGRQAKGQGAGEDADVVQPAPLEITLDPDIAATKLRSLTKGMAEVGGAEQFVEALRSKHELFIQLLPAEGGDNLTRDSFFHMLEAVFSARRRLTSFFNEQDELVYLGAVRDLVYGKGSLTERMERFAEIVPADRKKQRRGIRDLAAEILHFRDPERIPLMTNWVWDTATVSGAVRELIRYNDTMETIPLGTRPEDYEAVRQWVAEQLAANGFYRDIPYLVDLLLGHTYAEYAKAMSSGLGMVDQQFGAQQDPMEFTAKLLGLDARMGGKSRLKDPTVH